MEYFLPIAEVFVSLPLIFILSLVVGILSGLFGVGGGFLMTPFLIFLGIPPAYAVANEANNILATSVSGSTTHYLKNTLDYKMGLMIVIGGAVGTSLGIFTFSYFKGIGKIDTVISLAYMYILAIIGTLMLVESLREIDQAKRNVLLKKKAHVHYWIHGLPLRMRFPKSKLYESIFTPIIIGLIVGFIAAIMGIGGAFILVPAMIYIIKMPTKLVPGTSLFVTIFVSVIVTFLHSFNYGSIDLLLVLMLVIGSIVGVQLGQKLGERIDSSGLRALLAILLLIVGIAIAYDSFFAVHDTKEILNNGTKNLAPFSNFIKNEYARDLKDEYGCDDLWDYLELNYESTIIGSPMSHAWEEVKECIRRADQLGDPHVTALTKLLALIELFGRKHGITASKKLLSAAVNSKLKHSLQVLEEKSIVIFRKSQDEYRLFEGSDIDINSEVEVQKAQINYDWDIILKEIPTPIPIVPKRHYLETGALRWFERRIVSVSYFENNPSMKLMDNITGLFF